MKNRIVSIILIVLTLIGMVPCLSGCDSSSGDTISKGEVLALIADEFGMYTYSQTTPYTNTVSENDHYFKYVQMAYEWGIINDEDIDVNDKATKGFLAQALVNCVGIKDTADMSEEDITDYAVDNGYVTYNYRGRTDNIRNVTRTEVTESIDAAYNIWTNRKFEQKEEVTKGENVRDLSDGDVTPEQVIVDKKNNTVAIPESAAKEISNGDTFVVPDNNVDTTATAYVAEKIEYKDGYAVITTNEATLENTIQDMEVSGSVDADLTSVPVTDGVGNVIMPASASNMSANGTPTVSYLGAANAANATQCASGQLNFSIDGLSIKGSFSKNSVSVSVSGDLRKDNPKITVSRSFEISDISIDYDWDIDWFKLKSAYAKLNYKTKETTGISATFEKEASLFADQRGNYKADENGLRYWKNWYNKDLKLKATEKGAKTITICTFPIANGGIARIDVDIKLKISVTGEAELVVTTNNAYGLEYKNKSIRYIKEKSTDVDLNISAKIEGTAYAGVSLKALGMNIVGLGFEGGIGIEFKTIVHLVDQNNVKVDEVSMTGGNFKLVETATTTVKPGDLDTILCGEITTYFILKFTFDSDCEVYKLVKGLSNVSLEIEIFGKDNATIDALSSHFEDFKPIEKCTREFGAKTEEETEDEVTTDTPNGTTDTDNTTDSPDAEEGEDGEGVAEISSILDIDTYFINLVEGSSATLSISSVPDSYSESDVRFSSGNTAIATVDANGKITAVGAGVTEITAYIPNTKHTIQCSIFVSSANTETVTIPELPTI